MNNKNIFIIIFCILIVILIALGLFLMGKNRRDSNNGISSINKEEEIVSENEINATANISMYEIQEEYDGRKIIQIKADIQYETILAGILKNGMPKEDEISKILKNRPTKSGIWISKQSRDVFLNLLKTNNISGYEIDEDGYLYKLNNANNQKINTAIQSNKLYIFDILGKVYQRDELSGEIIEYPFEEMEPDQILENYSINNSSIIEITTNSRGILTDKEILEEVLLNIE